MGPHSEPQATEAKGGRHMGRRRGGGDGGRQVGGKWEEAGGREMGEGETRERGLPQPSSTTGEAVWSCPSSLGEGFW